MCAVMGMETARIEEILLSTEGAEIANYNCPGQIVITGYKEAVETAAQRLKEAGAKRTVMLNVSGPFHSPLLIPAGEALSEELSKVTLHDLRIPYVTNVSAEKVDDISRTKELLARQVSSPVRWQQSMELMISEGVDYFVEIGPGRTLAGFMKKISRDVTVYHISTWEDVGKVAGELC